MQAKSPNTDPIATKRSLPWTLTCSFFKPHSTIPSYSFSLFKSKCKARHHYLSSPNSFSFFILYAGASTLPPLLVQITLIVHTCLSLMKVYNSHPPFCLSSEDATTSCLAGIFGRLLCRSFRNCIATRHGNEKAEQKKIGSPGIVARLMGLDSMPVFPYTPPDSLKRSRSANSVESWQGSSSSGDRSQDVRIRSSLSSREAPTYLMLENDEFLILSFSPENSGNKAERVKHNDCNGGRKIRESSKKRMKKKDWPEMSSGDINDVLLSPAAIDVHRKSSRVAVHALRKKEMPISLDTKEKWISAQRGVEADDRSSRDSNPVSVLDHPCIDEVCSGQSSSGDKQKAATAKHQTPRRKLSLKFEDLSCSSSTFHPGKHCKEEKKKPFDRAGWKSSKFEQVTVDCTQIWGQICMLTEEYLKNMPWISKELCKSDEVNEIAAGIAVGILDPLLHDAVDDILNYLFLPMKL